MNVVLVPLLCQHSTRSGRVTAATSRSVAATSQYYRPCPLAGDQKWLWRVPLGQQHVLLSWHHAECVTPVLVALGIDRHITARNML